MKTAIKGKRVLSLLLALIITAGMFPLSLIPSLAADIVYADSPKWVSVGADSAASDEENYNGPTGLLTLLSDDTASGGNYTGDTMYIRLEKDISVDFERIINDRKNETNDGYMNIHVNGKKVLDLNGHKIKSKMMLGDGEPIYEACYKGSFLLVYGNLTVVDSKGGGEMKSDMQIKKYRPYGTYHYDLFHVMDGGELTINAPGATFTSGRSEKYYDDIDYFLRDHYYRSQSNGSAVDVHAGGKLTVAGGTFNGRGYSWYRRDHGYKFECAAVLADYDSTVHIIDGNFYGRGGADALDISDTADITVESGTFDVFKVDRLAETKNSVNTFSIVDGWYGDVGLPDRVKTQLVDKGIAVEIVKNGHDVTGDELDNSTLVTDRSTSKITVRPTSGSNNSDSRVSIVSESGAYSANTYTASSGDTYIVNASYKNPYFSKTALELSQANYRPADKEFGKNSAEYYLIWTFTLRDSSGSKVADLAKVTTPSEQTSVSVDLISEYGLSKWRNLSKGDYKIRCEVTECWKGEHTYKSTWRNEMLFAVSDNALLTYLSGISDFKLDFNVTHTKDLYVGDAQYLSFELDYSTADDLRELRDFYTSFYGGFDIMVSYIVETYSPKGNSYSTSTEPKPITSTVSVGVPDGAGPKVIIANVYIPKFNESTHKIIGYDVLSVRKNFLLLPTATKCVDSTSETVGYHKPVSLFLTDSYVEYYTAEDVWGAPLADYGTFSWQWYSIDEHDVGADVGIHGIGTPYSKYTVAAENNRYKISRDGTYRLAFSYITNDGSEPEEFVSVPIDIYASNTQGLRIATLSGTASVRPTKEELGKAPLRLDLGEGSWGTVEKVTLSIKSRPSQVAHSLAIEGESYFSPAVRKSYYLFNLYNFTGIKDAIANGCAGGEYTFRATVYGKDIYGYSYKEYTDEFNVTFEQEAEGYGLIVNGEYLGRGWSTEEEANAQVVPLFINSATPEITLQVAYYPEGATFDPNNSYTSYSWYGSNCSFLKGISGSNTDTYQMSITAPGVGIMSVYHSGEWIYYKICVPVTRVEFTTPNYENYIGKAYSEIKPTNVSLYAACGKKTSGSELLLHEGYEPYFWEKGAFFNADKVVELNDFGTINFMLHLPTWQCFPLEEVSEDKYMVDLDKVSVTINHVDGTGETLSAAARDAYMSWDKDYCNADDSYSDLTSYAGFKVTDEVFVKDKNATYIDLVTVTTTEPCVGDPINEGIKIYSGDGSEWQQLGFTCKAGDISTLSDISTEKGKDVIFVRSSTVSKATADTAGEHYSSANGAKAESGKSWAYSSFLNGKYENGTYFHELSLYTNTDPAADGTKYYFAPNARVMMNGQLLNIEDTVGYNKGNDCSYLALNYFYEVGSVLTVSEIDIDGITPLQGNLPATSDEVKLSATYKDGTKDSGKVEIKSMQWFVDANNNGKFDDGESVKANFWGDGTYKAESSTLWWDGTFLPGVEYSVWVQFGSDAAALRFASDLKADCDGVTPVFDTSTSFTAKFAADFTIRKISIKTSEGEDAADPAKRDPLALASASKAFNFKSIGVFKHKDYPGATADTNVHYFISGGNIGTETLGGGKYFYEFFVSIKDTVYTIGSNVEVLVNGKNYGETFAPNRNEIVIEGSGYSFNCYYCFTVPGPAITTVAVSGTVKSSGSATDDVTVKLMSGNTVAYETIVKGNSASFKFDSVEAGTYTLTVTKKGHYPSRTKITVEGEALTKNVTLSAITNTGILGDVNDDGNVNMKDILLIRKAVAGIVNLDEINQTNADMNSDDNINMKDILLLRKSVAGIIS